MCYSKLFISDADILAAKNLTPQQYLSKPTKAFKQLCDKVGQRVCFIDNMTPGGRQKGVLAILQAIGQLVAENEMPYTNEDFKTAQQIHTCKVSIRGEALKLAKFLEVEGLKFSKEHLQAVRQVLAGIKSALKAKKEAEQKGKEEKLQSLAINLGKIGLELEHLKKKQSLVEDELKTKQKQKEDEQADFERKKKEVELENERIRGEVERLRPKWQHFTGATTFTVTLACFGARFGAFIPVLGGSAIGLAAGGITGLAGSASYLLTNAIRAYRMNKPKPLPDTPGFTELNKEIEKLESEKFRLGREVLEADEKRRAFQEELNDLRAEDVKVELPEEAEYDTKIENTNNALQNMMKKLEEDALKMIVSQLMKFGQLLKDFLKLMEQSAGEDVSLPLFTLPREKIVQLGVLTNQLITRRSW